MSRTKRIYNSYRKYGRFFPKQGLQYEPCNGEMVSVPLRPFDLSLEYYNKNGKINEQYDRRWHPFYTICMGHCYKCTSERKSKKTKKMDELKFTQLYVS